ncbi:uncharacterized protein RSE6_11203 [Rhynchosporium secalis]|uniref:Uncharacterized protein n=1 Tax=Rhynchosporium secalis TaxID=38038 RepID=A0A1E1MME7_RHYSE|nr:uncharacterized protein RSE6_11203 [Rhynchosporium secalis]
MPAGQYGIYLRYLLNTSYEVRVLIFAEYETVIPTPLYISLLNRAVPAVPVLVAVVRIDRLSVEWGAMSDDGDDVHEAIIIMSLRILYTYLPREQRRIVNPSRYFVHTESREVLDYKCNADQASYEYPGGKSHRRMERGGGWAGGGWFSLMDEVTDPRSSRLQARAEVMSLPACRDSERYSVTYSLFPYSTRPIITSGLQELEDLGGA